MADHNASENCLYSTVILSGYFEPLFIHHAGTIFFNPTSNTHTFHAGMHFDYCVRAGLCFMRTLVSSADCADSTRKSACQYPLVTPSRHSRKQR